MFERTTSSKKRDRPFRIFRWFRRPWETAVTVDAKHCAERSPPTLATNTLVDVSEPTLVEAFRSFQKLHLGVESEELDEDHPSGHASTSAELLEAALQVWDDFHLQLLSKQAQHQFEASLQNWQYKSYKVFQEFLDGVSHDDPNPREVMRSVICNDDRTGTTYTEYLTLFFQQEMLFSGTLPYDDRASDWRSEQMKYVSLQKIAYSCLCSYRRASSFPDKTQKNSDSGYLLSRYENSRYENSRSDRARLPYYLWDRMQRRTVVVHELKFRPRYMCISHAWGRWESEGSVRLESVPWPVPVNSRFEVGELPSILAAADLPTQYVWFDLVCIPQGVSNDPDLNKRQAEQIAKQADIFANAVACVAWLNDVANWDGLLPAIKWMGLSYLRLHSGLSFPDAEHHMQDLEHNVNDASDMFRKVYFPPKQASGDQRLAEAAVWEPNEEGARLHGHFCCSRPLEQCFTGRRLCAARPKRNMIGDFPTVFAFPDWLSSLWTLQEACLCPDMSLASRSFTPLQVGSGVHVTLDSLTNLAFFANKSASRTANTLKIGFPNELCTSNPMDVIIMANDRQCSGERAPAVMSVLGVTSWYEKQIASHNQIPGEGQLVFGKYPLNFVREAAAKMGPLFFATCPVDCTRKSSGTMLPFCWTEDGPLKFPFRYDRIRQDAQCEPWHIRLSGAVSIRSAVVLATNQPSLTANKPRHSRKKILAWTWGRPGSRDGMVDLQELLDNLADLVKRDGRQSQCFAVHLAQSLTLQMGIILGGLVPLGLERAKMRKVGAYTIGQSVEQFSPMTNQWPPVPEAQAVDWLAY